MIKKLSVVSVVFCLISCSVVETNASYSISFDSVSFSFDRPIESSDQLENSPTSLFENRSKSFLEGELDSMDVVKWFEFGNSVQDGCIFNDTLFLMNSNGNCSVYNVTNGSFLCAAELCPYNSYIPHSNSVCFGKKLVESDPYPLFYTNVYNNYPNDSNSFGTCFVYRIKVEESLTFDLVQVIKIGFSNDAELWFDNSNNISPFGNFLVENNHLWSYLNIFGSSKTRFFRFNLPVITMNESDKEEYVELDTVDIDTYFDTELFSYIQGGTIKSDYLYSLSGFGNDSNPSLLWSVNLYSKEIHVLNINALLESQEPEFIDFYEESMVIGTHQGVFYKLTKKEINR